MAFNVNNYIKSTNKSALTKVSDSIVSKATAGLSSGVTAVANTTAQALLGAGASVSVTTNLTTLKADSTASGADSTYFALAGSNVDRTAGADLSSLRKSTNDLNTIVSSINPETKIAKAKSTDSQTIMAVV